MKKWALAMPVALATMFIAPGSALAATHIPTDITFDGAAAAGDGTTVFSGHVESPKSICVYFSLTDLVADGDVVDRGLTSLNGAWAMKTDPTGVTTLQARLKSYRFGPKGHRKVCDPDTVTIPLG